MVVDNEVIVDTIFESTKNKHLSEAVGSLAQACADIFGLLRVTLISNAGSANVFGDEQLTADIVAEKRMWECIADPSTHVAMGASEENPLLGPTGNAKGDFVCFWDPLDGSSIIPCNWSVGTIIALTTLPHSLEEIVGKSPRPYVKASIIAIHGPRLVLVVGLGHCCMEFTLVSDTFRLTCGNLSISDDKGKKFFAPANLRATATHKGYHKLVMDYMLKQYTLRYSGGLVPDVYHMLCKGHGIFVNPTTDLAPAKLRFLYETAPLSHLVESAGGASSDSEGRKILDIPIESMDQRTSLICGTQLEVEKCVRFLKSS